MTDLSDWRSQIDELDRELVRLLNRRAECVLQLAPLKKRANIDVLDPAREEQVHQNLRSANDGPLPHDSVREIFECVMAAMRDLQEQKAHAE